MPSRLGRRATAPLRIRAGLPRRRAMRISNHILSVAVFSLSLGCATAYALDGTRSPANVAPLPPGVGITPEGEPALGPAGGGLKAWARFMRDGNFEAARKSLEDGARNGDVMATWKLARM